MLQIYINDQLIESEQALTLEKLCDQHAIPIQQVAIAINQTFVPREKYAVTLLKHQDRIDIVSAMQGG